MGLTNPISLCIVFNDRVADTCVACDQRGSCGNSFFSYPEDIAMTKPFLTSQVQISFLEQDKNLLIENHTFAEAMLTQSLRSFASFSRKPPILSYIGGFRFYLVRTTGIEPARIAPMNPKSIAALSFLWKSKAYPIGAGQKIAYLFPAQGTKKNANQ